MKKVEVAAIVLMLVVFFTLQLNFAVRADLSAGLPVSLGNVIGWAVGLSVLAAWAVAVIVRRVRR